MASSPNQTLPSSTKKILRKVPPLVALASVSCKRKARTAEAERSERKGKANKIMEQGGGGGGGIGGTRTSRRKSGRPVVSSLLLRSPCVGARRGQRQAGLVGYAAPRCCDAGMPAEGRGRARQSSHPGKTSQRVLTRSAVSTRCPWLWLRWAVVWRLGVGAQSQAAVVAVGSSNRSTQLTKHCGAQCSK